MSDQGDEQVSIAVTRTAIIQTTDGKPGLELTVNGPEVSVVVLPKNGAKRGPIFLRDLKRAVELLSDAG